MCQIRAKIWSIYWFSGSTIFAYTQMLQKLDSFDFGERKTMTIYLLFGENISE